jgi:hypothetical protein
MNFKETKFAYRHKPTGKWAVLKTFASNWDVYLHLVNEFNSHCVYNARNVIEEDLMRSKMNGEKYASQNFLEFELVEIEVEYRIKQ